jgi:hypothetical protein
MQTVAACPETGVAIIGEGILSAGYLSPLSAVRALKRRYCPLLSGGKMVGAKGLDQRDPLAISLALPDEL